MIDERNARVRAHANNIRRYERLLATRLSDVGAPVHRKAPCGGAIRACDIERGRASHSIDRCARRRPRPRLILDWGSNNLNT